MTFGERMRKVIESFNENTIENFSGPNQVPFGMPWHVEIRNMNTGRPEKLSFASQEEAMQFVKDNASTQSVIVTRYPYKTYGEV